MERLGRAGSNTFDMHDRIVRQRVTRPCHGGIAPPRSLAHSINESSMQASNRSIDPFSHLGVEPPEHRLLQRRGRADICAEASASDRGLGKGKDRMK